MPCILSPLSSHHSSCPGTCHHRYVHLCPILSCHWSCRVSCQCPGGCPVWGNGVSPQHFAPMGAQLSASTHRHIIALPRLISSPLRARLSAYAPPVVWGLSSVGLRVVVSIKGIAQKQSKCPAGVVIAAASLRRASLLAVVVVLSLRLPASRGSRPSRLASRFAVGEGFFSSLRRVAAESFRTPLRKPEQDTH